MYTVVVYRLRERVLMTEISGFIDAVGPYQVPGTTGTVPGRSTGLLSYVRRR